MTTEHKHHFGEMQISRFGGNPYRQCDECNFVSLDFDMAVCDDCGHKAYEDLFDIDAYGFFVCPACNGDNW